MVSEEEINKQAAILERNEMKRISGKDDCKCKSDSKNCKE